MDNNKQILFSPFPKQQEFIDASLSGDYSFVLYGGAIRGGKTYALLALFILLCRVFPGSRWAIVRKDLPTIKRNLYPSWNKIKPLSFIKQEPSDSNGHTCVFNNDSALIFFSESYDTDKELDRWKGLEVNGFGFEEINECRQASLFKAFERAGSYVIPMYQDKDGVWKMAQQPKPLVVGTCNPTQGWVKELVHEPWEKGLLKDAWLYIQSRIYDNLPLLDAQPHYLPSLKANLNHYEYEVFVEGNWNVQLKTGAEFLRKFELNIHVKPTYYDKIKILHLSMDSNVYPYIGLTFWQIEKINSKWDVQQVHELPCEDPYNTASAAGKCVVAYLKSIGYNDVVYLYGDKSTKNRNNIDDEKRSFFQIINEALQKAGFRTVDKMLSHAPPVASVGDFVNAALSGEIPEIGSVTIGEQNKKSINDYIESKTDKDGTILKVRENHPKIKGLTYEKNGHLTDTFKDFMVQCFYKEYVKWMNRFKPLQPGGISTIKRGTSSNFTL